MLKFKFQKNTDDRNENTDITHFKAVNTLAVTNTNCVPWFKIVKNGIHDLRY